MTLIPARYHCSACAGYVGWVGERRPQHACSCPPAIIPNLPPKQRALEILGESLEANAARRQRFMERGYA